MTHTRYQRKSDHRGKIRPGGRYFAVRECARHHVLLAKDRYSIYCPLCNPGWLRVTPAQRAAKRKKRERRGQSKPNQST